jgi:hypothetical protein
MTSPLAAGLAVAFITLLAVAGPPLGLSPWLIALAVALSLGGLSLDAALLAGRGGHLLAEALPGGRRRLRRVAVHEAGHVLAAAVDDLAVRQVLVGSLACLRAGLAAGGSTEFDPPERAKLPLDQLRRWSRVLQAGMVAEALVYGSSIGGADDRALLGRLWGLSGHDVATARREQRQARREVEAQLRSQRHALDAEAERLLLIAPRFGRPAPTPAERLSPAVPAATEA